jgi:hypothetical protein
MLNVSVKSNHARRNFQNEIAGGDALIKGKQ